MRIEFGAESLGSKVDAVDSHHVRRAVFAAIRPAVGAQLEFLAHETFTARKLRL
jgi:hypothetical protein